MARTLTIKTNADYKEAQNANIQDDLNPAFLLTSAPTDILVDILNGKVDLKLLARQEMAGRGFDTEGKWVGFAAAEKIHGTK